MLINVYIIVCIGFRHNPSSNSCDEIWMDTDGQTDVNSTTCIVIFLRCAKNTQ